MNCHVSFDLRRGQAEGIRQQFAKLIELRLGDRSPVSPPNYCGNRIRVLPLSSKQMIGFRVSVPAPNMLRAVGHGRVDLKCTRGGVRLPSSVPLPRLCPIAVNRSGFHPENRSSTLRRAAIPIPPARKLAPYVCQARSTRAFGTNNMLAMLDGKEQRDCESRGACSTQAASAKTSNIIYQISSTVELRSPKPSTRVRFLHLVPAFKEPASPRPRTATLDAPPHVSRMAPAYPSIVVPLAARNF